MAKELGEINASSQADIAFLLLVFFLVTTSMSVDQGINRTLPPPPDPNQPESTDKINERNVFVVLINKDNQLAVEGEVAEVDMLTDRTIEFLTNPRDAADLAEKVKASKKLEEAMQKNAKEEEIKNYRKLVTDCGDPEISKGVVSLQNDRGTKYETYIAVQNAIVAAFNICRDKFSKEYFNGRTYDELSNDEQKVVKLAIPLNISEAEPRSVK
ncbi:MAG: biopolymer transporter ExbD [Bacteroidales bacterium]|jgi:biopolymer transport protein ExbD|nr:biopolymer transporter ExbD [Bacteroidales bacterium]